MSSSSSSRCEFGRENRSMARSIDDDIVFGLRAPLSAGFFILFRDE
jgi:hypothetical protein